MTAASRLSSYGRRLAFWTLLPLAAPQGLWLRRQARPFPAAAGPAHGRVGRGARLRLVFVGDSIVAGVGATTVAEALPGRLAAALAAGLEREVHWSAFGEVGARAAGVRDRLLRALAAEPFRAAVVSVGVNDAVGLSTTRRWRRDLGSLLDGLRAASADALVVVAGLPPLSGFPLLPQPLRFLFGLRARTFDAIAREEASRRPGFLHAPTDFDPTPERFSPDGFHPSSASYAEWGEELADLMGPHLR